MGINFSNNYWVIRERVKRSGCRLSSKNGPRHQGEEDLDDWCMYYTWKVIGYLIKPFIGKWIITSSESQDDQRRIGL